METREEFLRRNINERTVAIANGGLSSEKIDVLEREKFKFEEELANLQVVEEVMLPEDEQPAEPILSMVDGLPLEVYTRNDDAAALIRFEVELILETSNKAKETRINDLRIKNEHLQEIIRNGEADNRAQVHEIGNLREHISKINSERDLLKDSVTVLEEDVYQLTLERDEALKYRDNAVKQLEEMAFELEQNRIELNRNREVRALTEAERTAEQEAARQQFLDSRVKVYNMRFEDEHKIDTTWKLANVVETGEVVRYKKIYEEGLYVEVTLDEALSMQAMKEEPKAPEVDGADSFLTENPAQEIESGTSENVEESDVVLDGSEDDRQSDTLEGETKEITDSEANDQETSQETFEEWTRREINALKLAVFKKDPVFIHEVA